MSTVDIDLALPAGGQPLDLRMNCLVSAEPLDLAAAFVATAEATSGAASVFVGVVRDHDDGQLVASLEYAAHPTAERALLDVVSAQAARAPETRSILAWHRTGHLTIGDIALIVVVRTAHRREAMQACADLVETIKHEVPIWKRQHFTDGSVAWSNCP